MKHLRIVDVRVVAGQYCNVVFDEYIPIQMHSYYNPIGSGYLRLGNYKSSLLEIAIDPSCQMLRSFTVTLIDKIVLWPDMNVTSVTDGFPILSTDFDGWRVVDLPLEFNVSFHEDEIIIFWGEFGKCKLCVCGRTRFIVSGDELVGIWCVDILPNEMMLFRKSIS